MDCMKHKKTVLSILTAALVLCCGLKFAAAADAKTTTMTANVPAITPTLNIAIYDIWPGQSWDPGAYSLDFGTLILDNANRTWKADHYHAIDAAVTGNTANTWDLTLRGDSIRNAAGDVNLDNNINVKFVKVMGNNESELEYASYRTCRLGRNYTKDQLSGGFLRVYYSIATGSDDASGALPILEFQNGGHYEGTVQMTLTTT